MLIIALVILLLFGATKLPALAKSVGQSMKIFKNEMKTDENGNEKASDDAAKSDASSAPQSNAARTRTESKPQAIASVAARSKRGAEPRRPDVAGPALVELRKRLFRSAHRDRRRARSAAGSSPTSSGMRCARRSWRSPRPHNAALNYTDITAAFDLQIQIAFTIGIVISSPVWLYQIFAFLVPGLTGREKRYTFGFFFTAVPLFLAGCAAGWLVFPHIVELLTVLRARRGRRLPRARRTTSTSCSSWSSPSASPSCCRCSWCCSTSSACSRAKAILKGWRWAILVDHRLHARSRRRPPTSSRCSCSRSRWSCCTSPPSASPGCTTERVAKRAAALEAELGTAAA